MPAHYSRWLFIIRITGEKDPTMAYAYSELHATHTTEKLAGSRDSLNARFLNLHDFTGRLLHINLDYVTSVTTFVLDPEEVKKDQ